MAITFDVLEASAHSLRYFAQADGAGTSNSLTQAQLIEDAKAGPLKALLQASELAGNATPANDEWGALNGSSALSVLISPSSPSPAVIGFVFGLVGGGSVHTLICTALAAGAAVIEIRYNPTINR